MDYRKFLSLTTVALLSGSIPGIQASAATPAQEAALRAQVKADSISHGWTVRVTGVFSEGIWGGVGVSTPEGGGVEFYKLGQDGWKFLISDGGVLSPQELHELAGVPLDTAKILLTKMNPNWPPKPAAKAPAGKTP